jgi:hypothetical protein
MKKPLPFIVLMLLDLYVWSQNSNPDYKYAVKLYNLTTFEDNSKHELDLVHIKGYDISSKTLQILHPTVAFQWKTKKNNCHEIELTSLNLDKAEMEVVEYDSTGTGHAISGADIITSSVSIRYEFIMNFNASGENKLVPSVGFAGNPYYRQIIDEPKVSDLYRTSEKFIGARAFVIPRLIYYFSSEFFIDLDIPICFFDLYLQSEKDQDPRLPAEDQTANTVNFDLFPVFFSGRIGVGLKL